MLRRCLVVVSSLLFLLLAARLRFMVAKHRMRNQPAIVLLMCAVETCLDNALSERIEIRH